MKIILERTKCIGCGACAGLCPKYFELIEDGKSQLKGSEKNQKTGNYELELDEPECVNEAADSCPVECIYILEKS